MLSPTASAPKKGVQRSFFGVQNPTTSLEVELLTIIRVDLVPDDRLKIIQDKHQTVFGAIY